MDTIIETLDAESTIQQPEIVETKNMYFSVSTVKLIVMAFCTLGFYKLYWLYKNFKRIQELDSPNLSPVLRTLFSTLWSYSAFQHMQETADYKELGIEVHALWCAIIYFLLQLTYRLPDPYYIVGLLSVLPVIFANKVATEINQSLNPQFVQNSSFSRWNWAAIIVGSLIWILAAIGTYLPEKN